MTTLLRFRNLTGSNFDNTDQNHMYKTHDTIDGLNMIYNDVEKNANHVSTGLNFLTQQSLDTSQLQQEEEEQEEVKQEQVNIELTSI